MAPRMGKAVMSTRPKLLVCAITGPPVDGLDKDSILLATSMLSTKTVHRVGKHVSSLSRFIGRLH